MVREPDSRRLVEKTEWHDVVAFDDLAARIRSSVDKGSRVRVTGYMRTKKWDDKKTGQVHFKHELVALDIEVKQRLTGRSHPGPRARLGPKRQHPPRPQR